MNPISIISFITFFLLLLSFVKHETDVFSPGRMFALIWILAIGLAELKLSRFQFEWSLYSWFTLLVPIFSFLLGVFIVYVINMGHKQSSISEIRSRFHESHIDMQLLYWIIIILFTLYSISFTITYLIRGFLPMFTKMPEVARTKWGVFGYGTFVLSIPTLLYLSLLYLFIAQKNLNKKILISIIFIVATLTYSTLLNRFYLILPIALIIISLYYKTNKLRPRNILIILTVFCIVFFGISSIRLSRYAINILYYLSDMKYGIDYAVFTEPYMYITMNLENFARAVEKLDVFTYGYFSTDFILFPIGLKKELFEYLRIVEFPYIITSSFNTYTMFFIYYRDFGIFGVLFLPLILGSIITSIYYRMRKNPNINNISLYGIFVFVLIFSFFVPILHWIHFVFNIGLIYFSTILIVKENKYIYADPH